MFAAMMAMAQGRSPKWPAVRKAHLRAHPECAACGRREKLNAHHVKPFRLWPELELDPDNLLTLCEWPSMSCHLWVGHGGRWDWWNPHAAIDAAVVRTIIGHAREGESP